MSDNKLLFFFIHCRIIVESEDYKTTFILKKAQRGDTGVYSITAKNSSGTDVAEVEIIVLCKYLLDRSDYVVHLLMRHALR